MRGGALPGGQFCEGCSLTSQHNRQRTGQGNCRAPETPSRNLFRVFVMYFAISWSPVSGRGAGWTTSMAEAATNSTGRGERSDECSRYGSPAIPDGALRR